MEVAPEQLQVVAAREDDPGDDEDEEPRADAGDADETEGDRAAKADGGGADEEPCRDLRAQWPVMELVEGMGTHADGKEERDEGGDQSTTVESLGEGGADRDV